MLTEVILNYAAKGTSSLSGFRLKGLPDALGQLEVQRKGKH